MDQFLALMLDPFVDGRNDANGPALGFAPGPDSVATFEAWPDGESPVTQPSQAAISPNQGGGALTMRPEALAERIEQGATPSVPRAAALGSTTPAAADQTPVEAFASVLAPSRPARLDLGEKRDYLALIPPERLESEKHCLAQAVYFEARSEPEAGQVAVAQVIVNRMTSGLYPSTICGVVFQNRRHFHACQFSFACEGKSLRIHEAESWLQATRIADDVLGCTKLTVLPAPIEKPLQLTIALSELPRFFETNPVPTLVLHGPEDHVVPGLVANAVDRISDGDHVIGQVAL